jgi:hypothetical protein
MISELETCSSKLAEMIKLIKILQQQREELIQENQILKQELLKNKVKNNSFNFFFMYPLNVMISYQRIIFNIINLNMSVGYNLSTSPYGGLGIGVVF